MTTRPPGSSISLAIVITALSLAPIIASGQGGTTRVVTGAGRSTLPRTPWGHPDLQAVWSNATTTPLERPSELSEKEVLSDSTVFTKPWTGSIPLAKFDAKIYEYACHEGNYAMEHILSGARAEEAKSVLSKTNR